MKRILFIGLLLIAGLFCSGQSGIKLPNQIVNQIANGDTLQWRVRGALGDMPLIMTDREGIGIGNLYGNTAGFGVRIYGTLAVDYILTVDNNAYFYNNTYLGNILGGDTASVRGYFMTDGNNYLGDGANDTTWIGTKSDSCLIYNAGGAMIMEIKDGLSQGGASFTTSTVRLYSQYFHAPTIYRLNALNIGYNDVLFSTGTNLTTDSTLYIDTLKRVRTYGNTYLGNGNGDITTIDSRLIVDTIQALNKIGINCIGYFSPLAVVSNATNTGYTTRYSFNFVDGVLNKNRSTYAQAIDTSSYRLMWSPLGKPLMDITGNTGNSIFKLDSLGYFGINNSAPTDYLHIRVGSGITLGQSIDQYSTTTTDYPQFAFRHSLSNTLGTLTQTTNGTILGSIVAYGVTSTPAWSTVGTSIEFVQNGISGTGGQLADIKFNGISSANGSSKITRAIINYNGKLSLAGNTQTLSAPATPSYSISFLGSVTQTIGVESNASTAAGSSLSISAGGNTAGGTADLNGGLLSLTSGISKGTGYASVRIQRNSRASSTGTALNTQRDAVIIPSDRILSNNTATTIVTIAFPSDSTTYGNSVNGVIHYQVAVRGSNGAQSESGEITFTGVEYGGVVTSNIGIDHERESLSTGTLAVSATLTYAAGTWTIQVTSNSNLTSPATKFDYVLISGNNGTITQF